MVKLSLKTVNKIFITGLTILLLFCSTIYAQSKENIFTCRGTYYHNKFENRRTSSGELFSQKLYTAAHRTLPLHTIVKVTNNRTGKSVLVKINDRCGRNGIIDLSKSAADKISLNGSETVTIEVLGKDYVDIWNQQNAMFAEGLVVDSERVAYIDSLITERKVISEYQYYVRLKTVEGEKNVKKIQDNLPEQYKRMMSAEKIYNEKFYYINIGPFPTENAANLAINELKKMYPLAHLIKKKEM
ncbi:MAG: septal ring lytic transglycosylase RlpA family protein [Clostridia bacterium]|nr:septal ring lytic transglycosylase RlpA family protein [Clostridia bacterium]